MNLKPALQISFLKIYMVVYYLVLFIFTVIRWDILSKGEGWGVVYVVGLGLIGLVLLGVDLLLSLFLKNKLILNIIEIIIGFFFSLSLFIGT